MKKNNFKFYYFFLILGTLAMVANTIVTGSQYVSNGQKVSSLEKQKKDLITQEQLLQKNGAQELTINEISRFAQTQGYAPISQVATVRQLSEKVASR